MLPHKLIPGFGSLGLLIVGILLTSCAPALSEILPTPQPPSIEPLPPLPVERPAESAADGQSDAELTLGKHLFFDPALSGDQSLHCGSCHRPDLAWTDGLPLSAGYPSTQYFRNTPTLLNVGQKPVLYWDGRLDDLPTVVRDHIAEAHFMNADGRLVMERLRQKPQYVGLFQENYGGAPSYGGILNAIAAYVSSLRSADSPYSRFLAGDRSALSAPAQAGLEVFEANCAECHSGPLLSDGRHHQLGVPENHAVFTDPLRHITFRRFFRTLGVPEYAQLRHDIGLAALTQDAADRGAFITPSLWEVAQTAPYMHNGVFESLEAVLAFYASGPESRAPLNLSQSESAALLAFLESLSSELPVVSIPEPPPYQLSILGDRP